VTNPNQNLGGCHGRRHACFESNLAAMTPNQDPDQTEHEDVYSHRVPDSDTIDDAVYASYPQPQPHPHNRTAPRQPQPQQNHTQATTTRQDDVVVKVVKKNSKKRGKDGSSSTTTTSSSPSFEQKQHVYQDNRDSLPFVVQLTTPDPYTKSEFKKERARKNTEQDRKRALQRDDLLPRRTRRSSSIAATMYELGGNGDQGESFLLPILGEFYLDKSTTSGDIVCVGEQSYQVQKARCQYKYVGGQQKFEMVRKILEVKPILRVQTEAVLQRSLQQSTTNDGWNPQTRDDNNHEQDDGDDWVNLALQ
jgi:hypothetical protein